MESVNVKQPLVSIIVVTFNSGSFLIDTLESAKAQTYPNIELIVSDDCSTDDTIKICERWISQNKDRFIRVQLITTPKNTGVTANCNRGFKASSGQWLKYIAGDDALLPNCIKDNLNFTVQNPAAQIIHSIRKDYKELFSDENFMGNFPMNNDPFTLPQIKSSEQYEILLRECSVSAPTVFIKSDLLEKMNGFDERIPMVEDWPLWLKSTSKGYKLFFMNKATVKYRVHDNSLTLNKKELMLFTSHNQRMHSVHRYYIYPNLPPIERLLYAYDFKRMEWFKTLGINKNTKLLRFINKVTAYPAVKYRRSKYKSLLTQIKK